MSLSIHERAAYWLTLSLPVLNLKEDPMKTCIFFTLSCSILCSALLAQPPAVISVSPETVVAKVDGKGNHCGRNSKGFAEHCPPQIACTLPAKSKSRSPDFFVMRYLADEGENFFLGERTPLKEQLETQRANALAGARLNYEHDNYQVPVNVVNEYYMLRKLGPTGEDQSHFDRV